MKLLIRTITIATLGLYMFLMVLNATVIETIKQETEVATEAAMNRVVIDWERNQQLIDEGNTNLFFKTDEDFYYFFYDSLVVQMNGRVDVTVYCNDINVEKGILDVDVTVNYKGIDKEDRTYTVHSSTDGKISKEFIEMSDYKKSLLKQISLLEVGDYISWAGYQWVIVDNTTDGIILALDGTLGAIAYDNIEYKYSSVKPVNDGFFARFKDEEAALLGEYSMDKMNTLNGIYLDAGTDTYVAKVFILSEEEAEKLREAGYETSVNY